MKRILYSSGHSRMARKWGMVGEVARVLMDDPNNEVFYLDCNGNIKGPCGLNAHKHIGYCRKCQIPCLKVLKQAGFPDDHILKMQRYKSPKFPKFKTIQEAIDYDCEGYNLGLGPISCVMTLTRDYRFDLKKWQKHIERFFETEYIILKNIEHYNEIYHFDEIHCFNGRMASMYPYVAYAKKHNIPYTVYEGGSQANKMLVLHNYASNDFEGFKGCITDTWENGKDENKEEIAKKWFDDRRNGNYQFLGSFTKDQKKDSLPKEFDKSKENLVFFNSSIDEVIAYPDWKLPFGNTENDIIEAILEHYKDDENKHFYLRVHPNLLKAKKKNATQIREINAMKKKYKNLTVIGPDEKIDTYAIMKAADKVLTTYSTTGIEATYHGCVAISAGRPLYVDLDCVYRANSLENLFELIDDKTLVPKPKESTYPWGYFRETYGVDFKYLNMKSYTEGEFLGLKLKSK